MGAEPWQYFVPFEADLEAALDRLKQREFQAGRFRSSEENPASIEEARELGDASGTGSILDMERIGQEPDFFVVCPLPPAQLLQLFGTEQPTRTMIESNPNFYDDIERGQGIAIIVHEGGKPTEIFFAGYSFD